MNSLKNGLKAFVFVIAVGGFVIEFLWALVEIYQWGMENYNTYKTILLLLGVIVLHFAIVAAIANMTPTKETPNDQNTPE